MATLSVGCAGGFNVVFGILCVKDAFNVFLYILCMWRFFRLLLGVEISLVLSKDILIELQIGFLYGE